MTNSILSDEFLLPYKTKIPKWGFGVVGWVVFKRTYARTKQDGKVEEWWETIRRCIDGAQKIGAKYTKEEAQRLFDYIFNLKGSFSGRSLWQLGTDTVTDLGMDSLLSCWVTKIDCVEDFCFIFMESMMGGGVGPVLAREFTYELPRVKNGVTVRLKNTKDADFIVPDSKEGWCELWRRALNAHLVTGKSFTYSTICIRPNGEPIKRFGGIAPGPKPLIDGLSLLSSVMENRYAKKLRSQDVADIICIGGEIVKSGGVRRTALILHGDVDDGAFLQLKRWDLGNIPNYRSNSNNSLLCSDFGHLSEKFWDGYVGNGEPYGLVNVKNARKFGRLGESEIDGYDLYDGSIIGTNPCLPPWAKVITRGGIRNLSDVKIGDEIWSKQGWTKVLNIWSTGIKKVFEYKTTAGTFYGTENHRLVSSGEKVEAKDCESIDIIRGPVAKDTSLNPINIKDVMDGLVIGDGTVHHASNDLVYLNIGAKDGDYLTSEIASLVTKERSGISKYAYEIDTTISKDELDLTFKRKIPSRFIYGSPTKVRGFLRGLYSANGSICGKRVTLKAASFSIIADVQTMLSSLGIRSYYTSNKASDVVFSNGEYTCKQSYDLNISSDRREFSRQIGFIQKYKTEILNSILSTPTNKGKNTYDIVSVTQVSEEEVFDITVENSSHTFWNNCCDVSNCAEAFLADKECCNLAELFLNNISSKEEMLDIATLLYKTQKAICAGSYIHEETNKIVHKNMRIGLGVTGACNLPKETVKEWCDYTYKNLRKFDKEYSKQNGWPISVRLTVVKPSGTLSLVGGSKPGGHAGYDKFMIRRIRFSANDAILKVLRKAGYKIEPEVRFDGSLNHDILVVDFPCKFEDDGPIATNFSALDQLEMLKMLQTCWADQAVSITVYYKPEELPAIKKWLKENYNTSVKSVSFLLHSEHGFKQAPLEGITEEQYHQLSSKLKPVEMSSEVTAGGDIDSQECVNGACPIK